MTTKIKTMIIMDFMGTSEMLPEQEAALIAQHFQKNYDITLDYDFAEHANNIYDREYKLIIFDYGGILPGADDMVNAQLRYVTKWAEDHPSRILLFWTSFTARLWQWEIKDEFRDLPNVLFYDPIDDNGSTTYFYPELLEHQNNVVQQIRTIHERKYK